MQTKVTDKSPNKVNVHGRMSGMASYTPDENKWSNYVPIRKNHSTSKAEASSKPLFQNDIENEFKKALDSMKRQKTEKRSAVSTTRLANSSSTKGAISRLRQENNDKLNESLDRSFNIKSSNLQTTGRSSRSINYMGSSSIASNLSNTQDLDISMNKSMNGIDSPQLDSSKKFKSKGNLQRDKSASSIKNNSKSLSKSPAPKSESKLRPSPSPSAKSITSPKVVNMKVLNSSEKISTPSKSSSVKSNIKKINSASNLNKVSPTINNKGKNTASQNKITPTKPNSAGEKLIGLLNNDSELRLKKLEQDLNNTTGKKNISKDYTVNDRLEKANADLKRKQEELALSYKKYAIEKFIAKIEKHVSHIYIGAKREGFIMLLSEIQRQNIKITQFLTWHEESIKRSYFDTIVKYQRESQKRILENEEKAYYCFRSSYQIRFLKLWKSTLASYKSPVDSRKNSLRQSSLDSGLHSKKGSLELDNSKKMNKINSSIDRLSLTKSVLSANDNQLMLLATFSNSKIDKDFPSNFSPVSKGPEKVNQSDIYNSRLDHSFGCDTQPRESVMTEKENEPVLAGLSPSRDDKDESLPDQVLTQIPKPITRENPPTYENWTDKENKKSVFEKKPDKTPILKESSQKLSESNNNKFNKSISSPAMRNEKKEVKKSFDKKPPIGTRSTSELNFKGSAVEKENPVQVEKAKNHYNRRLLKIFGFLPLQKIWNKHKMQNLEAREFNKLNLIKKVFRILENGQIEEEMISICKDVSFESKKASQHHELMLKINTFNAFLKNFVQSFEEAETYNKVREDFLKRKVFTNWFLHKNELKDEVDSSIESSDDYEGITEKFRFIILGEKVFRTLRKIAEEEKLNKIKLAKHSNIGKKSPISSTKYGGKAK